MAYQLFIAVSTGQNVANLVPILEFANPGDRVIWIETEEARARKWRKGSDAVLKSKGIIVESSVSVDDLNDPQQLADELRPILISNKRGFNQFYIIANGGYKFTPIGLGLAIEKADIGNCSFLYSLDKPAKIIELKNGTWDKKEHYYQKTAQLDDIIKVRDKVILPGAKLIWEWGKGRINPVDQGLPVDIEELKHILIERNLHVEKKEAIRLNWRIFFNILEESAELDGFYQMMLQYYKNFNLSELQKISDYIIEKFSNHYQIELKPISVGQELLDQSQALSNKVINYPEMFPSVNDLIKKYSEITVVQFFKDISKEEEKKNIRNDTNTPNYIGVAFENTVAEAVLRWVESKEFKHQSLSQIWQNVKVAPDINSFAESELDVVLVVANGIVIHLECKSYSANQKDLDARITTLHAASSILSEMYVVFPKFTAFANTEWFIKMESIQRSHFSSQRYYRSISYTHPGQPLSWREVDEEGNIETKILSTFEETLDQIFNGFTNNGQ